MVRGIGGTGVQSIVTGEVYGVDGVSVQCGICPFSLATAPSSHPIHPLTTDPFHCDNLFSHNQPPQQVFETLPRKLQDLFQILLRYPRQTFQSQF